MEKSLKCANIPNLVTCVDHLQMISMDDISRLMEDWSINIKMKFG